MSRVASIDGAIASLDVAVVPVLDRGFLYGDGVFETLRVYGGRPFLLGEHLARLARSATALRIALPVPLADLAQEVEDTLRAANEPEASVRIMITRGAPHEPSLVPPLDLRATRVILVQPVRPPPREVYARGLHVITLSWGRPEDLGDGAPAKRLSYATSIVALDEARARAADDALFVGPDGYVREATFSNVFALSSAGDLLTPPAGPGVLEGLTRGLILELASTLGLTCRVAPVSRGSLGAAREVFLTSSVREVASVVRVDGAPIGAGVPGPIARALHVALRGRAGAAGPPPWE